MAAAKISTSGQMSAEYPKPDSARALYTEALSAAQLAGNDPMSVQVLAGMSLQSIYVRRPREGLNFARRAQQMAASWGTARLASVLSIREARALAATKDTAGRSAFQQAGTRLERATEEDAGWLAFHDDAELTANAGLCYADLGQHRVAATLLAEALAAQAPAYSRYRALYRVRCAESLLQMGEAEQACVLAAEAVDQMAEVSSACVVSSLRRFGRWVADVDTAAARGFGDRLAAAKIA